MNYTDVFLLFVSCFCHFSFHQSMVEFITTLNYTIFFFVSFLFRLYLYSCYIATVDFCVRLVCIFVCAVHFPMAIFRQNADRQHQRNSIAITIVPFSVEFIIHF